MVTLGVSRFLTGWKQIASYLGKGVRTCQRYEREMGLPIHRPAEKSSASVIAMPAELDTWVTTGSSRAESMPKRLALNARTNRLRANFLQVDCEIALTFSNIALQTSDQERRKRTATSARKAYDTILRFKPGTDLGDADRDKLEAKLLRLKSELQSLGQRF